MFVLLFYTAFVVRLFEAYSFNSTYDGGKIVKGFLIDIEDVPYQVEIEFEERHICGGSIISRQYILTAAHCLTLSLRPPIASKYQVRVGTNYRLKGGTLYDVAEINQHPRYNPRIDDYDFGIMRLSKPLIYGKRVQPIRLPNSYDIVRDGALLMASGYGRTKNPRDSYTRLHAVLLRKINFSKCLEAFEHKRYIVTPSMFCAGSKNNKRDSCKGDSGGPIVKGKLQVGIISWGYKCAIRGYPGVYALIVSARDWIKKVAHV